MIKIELGIQSSSVRNWFVDQHNGLFSFPSIEYHTESRWLESVMFVSDLTIPENFLKGFFAGKTESLWNIKLDSVFAVRHALTNVLMPFIYCKVDAEISQQNGCLSRHLLASKNIDGRSKMSLLNLRIAHAMDTSGFQTNTNVTHQCDGTIRSNTIYVDIVHSVLYRYERGYQYVQIIPPLAP